MKGGENMQARRKVNLNTPVKDSKIFSAGFDFEAEKDKRYLNYELFRNTGVKKKIRATIGVEPISKGSVMWVPNSQQTIDFVLNEDEGLKLEYYFDTTIAEVDCCEVVINYNIVE
jgi:hypothetical protein